MVEVAATDVVAIKAELVMVVVEVAEAASREIVITLKEVMVIVLDTVARVKLEVVMEVLQAMVLLNQMDMVLLSAWKQEVQEVQEEVAKTLVSLETLVRWINMRLNRFSRTSVSSHLEFVSLLTRQEDLKVPPS